MLSFPNHEGWQLNSVEAHSWGDLIVSIPAVARGAKRAGVTWQKELTEVLIHGVLHLLGMDHVKSQKRAVRMRQAQKYLLKRV